MSNLYNPHAKTDRVLYTMLAIFVALFLLMVGTGAGWLLTQAAIFATAVIVLAFALTGVLAGMFAVMFMDDHRLYGNSHDSI